MNYMNYSSCFWIVLYLRYQDISTDPYLIPDSSAKDC